MRNESPVSVDKTPGFVDKVVDVLCDISVFGLGLSVCFQKLFLNIARHELRASNFHGE